MKASIIFVFISFAVANFCESSAQSNLSVTLFQADSMLINGNLSAIAAKFEIDKASARIVQEKLFSNPAFAAEFATYTASLNKWLDVGPSGQKAFSLQKSIDIAGKRNLRIKIAQDQKKITEQQYYDIVRALRYQMHSDFFRLYYLNNIADSISSQLAKLGDLIDAFESQYAKGNISLKELTRLKTSYFDLSNNVTGIRAESNTIRQELNVLLGTEALVRPNPLASELDKSISITPNLETLKTIMLQSRPDIAAGEMSVTQAENIYRLQKQAAIPNLNTGGLYDQGGSYARNYYAITLGMELPFFNRNQGAIKEAQINVDQSKVLLQQTRIQAINELESTFNNLSILRQQLRSVGNQFESQLNELSRNSVENYLKKNISLLEFTDVFEAYNQSIISLNQLKINITNAYEELNYAVGQDVDR
jgi:cobalt-zinc-cadmium efflux system outer membrane protein